MNPYEQEAIFNLQRYLRNLSFREPDLPFVPIDGIYGDTTQAAVREFQKSRGLPVTGNVDPETWELLYLAYLQSLEAGGRTEPLYLFPRNPETYSVGVGDEGLIISAIRYLLRELMIDYGGEFEEIPLTGTYDTPTEDAVRYFQRLHGLPITGRVDRFTWNRLVQAQRPEAVGYSEE